MALKVIGAGFGRTGTLSLKYALERLGFDQCYHMMEMMNNREHVSIWTDAHAGIAIDWDQLFTGYQASVDWPSCNLWQEQWAHFPDAKILLSLRDAQRWYESVMETIYETTRQSLVSDDPRRQASGQWAMNIIWSRLFDGRMDDRQHVIDVFNRHNENVIKTVPADKLLVFEARDGWVPLCDFLDVDVPAEDYPRVNTRDTFWETF
ncbi:MAG: sulfotransferase family protein [Proteobacteria bacterium]|nr:sulfotransferase family protein [Pseudomonadota bacterium]